MDWTWPEVIPCVLLRSSREPRASGKESSCRWSARQRTSSKLTEVGVILKKWHGSSTPGLRTCGQGAAGDPGRGAHPREVQPPNRAQKHEGPRLKPREQVEGAQAVPGPIHRDRRPGAPAARSRRHRAPPQHREAWAAAREAQGLEQRLDRRHRGRTAPTRPVMTRRHIQRDRRATGALGRGMTERDTDTTSLWTRVPPSTRMRRRRRLRGRRPTRAQDQGRGRPQLEQGTGRQRRLQAVDRIGPGAEGPAGTRWGTPSVNGRVV